MIEHHQVLFCPFCRESFEGKVTCPEHELALVGFERLGPDPLDPENLPEMIDETPLGVVEPSFGRGIVAAAAFLNLGAFLCDFLRSPAEPRGIAMHALLNYVPSLWTPTLVSFTLLFTLYRRRTPRALRSVRVLVALLAPISPLTCWWAYRRIEQGVLMWPSGRQVIDAEMGLAGFAVALASILMLVGAVRLGVLPRGVEKRRLVGASE